MLNHAVSTYQTIRNRIIAIEADLDDQTLTDTLEGITDLHEVVAAVVRSALIDEALAEGLKGHIETLQGRLRRLSERADARRQIARDAMLEVDLKKITAPDFTVSVRPGTPALVVTEEKLHPRTLLACARAAPRPAGFAQRPQEGRGGVRRLALQPDAGAQREGQVEWLSPRNS